MAEDRKRKSGVLTRVELLLWIAGASSLGVCLVTGVRAMAARREAAAYGRPMAPQTAAQAAVGGQDAAERTVPVVQQGAEASAGAAQVIGRMEIPRIGLSVPVMADYDPNSLLRGIGHIHGTAVPGGLGTMGLAGHRDTYFRPLERIEPGMDIRVADASGTYHYDVDSTEIVTPEQVEVLDIRQRPELTLITCYPFHYIGAAPKRFIVHAHLVSAAPDAP